MRISNIYKLTVIVLIPLCDWRTVWRSDVPGKLFGPVLSDRLVGAFQPVLLHHDALGKELEDDDIANGLDPGIGKGDVPLVLDDELVGLPETEGVDDTAIHIETDVLDLAQIDPLVTVNRNVDEIGDRCFHDKSSFTYAAVRGMYTFYILRFL